MAANNNALRHIDAYRVKLLHEPIELTQRVTEDASVTTGHIELGMLNGCSIGIWEMSSVTMTDIEEDEYFIVLAGHGSLQVFAENGFTYQTQQLTAGSIVRLVAGMRTQWHIDEPLRKIYLTPSDA